MKDGYPEQKELVEINRLANEPNKVLELMEAIDEAYSDYGRMTFTKGTEEWMLTLATGGWSGNEDIVDVLCETMFWSMYWQESKRGGAFVFKGAVPQKEGRG